MTRGSDGHGRRKRKRQASAHDTSDDRQIELRAGPFVMAFAGVLLVGGGALAAAFIARSGPPPEGSTTGASQAGAAVQSGQRAPSTGEAWFTADGDPALGSPEAPVTIVEFSDYQCPNCRQFATEVLPWLRRTWMADGLVRVVYRDFAIRGPASLLAAEAAHCAGEQGDYWGYHDALFEHFGNGGAYTADAAAELGRTLGLDSSELRRCLAEGRFRERVQASTDDALARGFQGTPTYVIDGRETSGAKAVADWEALFQLYMRDFARMTEEAG